MTKPTEKDPSVEIHLVDQDGDNLVGDNTKIKLVSGECSVSRLNSSAYSVFDIQKKSENVVELKITKPNLGFGRMFKNLKPFKPDTAALIDLGNINGPMFDVNLAENDNPLRSTSFFTYFNQFIDHVLTLDPTPFVDAALDISQIQNLREGSLRLESLFGGGPAISPQLYDVNGKFILTQNGRDLQRGDDGIAVLVEPRNDENLIIAQIHVAFCRYFNALRDTGKTFAEAMDYTILTFQYIVLNIALPKEVSEATYQAALNNELGLYKSGVGYTRHVEFTGAIFREFHSRVRKAYVMSSDQLAKTQVFSDAFPATQDLRGGRAIPPNLIIQWSNFVEIPGTTNPQPPVNINRKLDVLLSSGLFALPPGAAPTGPRFLAQRNLIRGKSYGLPSGQAVALAMGVTPYTNEQIGLTDPRFNGEAPLWYYVLAEANIETNGGKFGTIGGKILADTIVGTLRKDPNSILNANKGFIPHGNPNFSVGDFLKIAGVA